MTTAVPNHGFTLDPARLSSAAEAFRSNADLPVTTANLLGALGDVVSTATGVGLHAVLTGFSAAWTAALADIIESVTELGLLLTRSAEVYLAVDDEVSYQFGAVHR